MEDNFQKILAEYISATKTYLSENSIVLDKTHSAKKLQLDISGFALEPTLIILIPSGIEYTIKVGPMGSLSSVEGLMFPFSWKTFTSRNGQTFVSLLEKITGDEHHLDAKHADKLDDLFRCDKFTSIAQTLRPLVYESWAHCIYVTLIPQAQNPYHTSILETFGPKIAAVLTW